MLRLSSHRSAQVVLHVCSRLSRRSVSGCPKGLLHVSRRSTLGCPSGLLQVVPRFCSRLYCRFAQGCATSGCHTGLLQFVLHVCSWLFLLQIVLRVYSRLFFFRLSCRSTRSCSTGLFQVVPQIYSRSHVCLPQALLQLCSLGPVSYTHLTLPTTASV